MAYTLWWLTPPLCQLTALRVDKSCRASRSSTWGRQTCGRRTRARSLRLAATRLSHCNNEDMTHFLSWESSPRGHPLALVENQHCTVAFSAPHLRSLQLNDVRMARS